jgi:hypothetical protein
VRIQVDRGQLPVPSLVLFLLTHVMGMVDLGRDDKTAWQVPFEFRGHPGHHREPEVWIAGLRDSGARQRGDR